MRGSIGTATGIYHTRLPKQWELERMFSSVLSPDAKKRLRWIDHYIKHKNARLTCRYFGISPTTFYKWLNRFKKNGLQGLESLSSAPKRKRTSQIPWQVVNLVVSLRKEYPAWSKYKLEVILKRDYGITLSASSISRILKRKGLYDARVSQRRRRAAKRRKKRLRSEPWMKKAFPGSLIQIDTKHLSFPGRKFYQFTAIDCFSRISFSKVYGSASSQNAKAFLEELISYMPFSLAAIQTDNGGEFLKKFDEKAESLFITHYFSHPNCPKENAFVERKIQTDKYELWAFEEGYTVDELNSILDEWNYKYNYIRLKESLGYLTPFEFFNSCTCKMSTPKSSANSVHPRHDLHQSAREFSLTFDLL